MKKVNKDLNDVVSLREKEQLLRELKQEDLLDLFKKGYKSTYKQIEAKKATLDQQISIAIAKNEKDKLGLELAEIKRASGQATSIASFVRNKAVSQIDIVEWYEHALEGLKTLTSSEYDEKNLTQTKRKYLKLLDNLDESDKETEYVYNNRLNEINEKLNQISRTKPQRGLRLTGRVTFSEANVIRWRAARLSLTVADYMRFVIFNYLPFTEADKHLTIDQRKRFYISIIDVHKNGWGNPPNVNDCPNCARLQHDIDTLRQQLARYKSING